MCQGREGTAIDTLLWTTRPERRVVPGARTKGLRLTRGGTVAVPSVVSPGAAGSLEWLRDEGFELVSVEETDPAAALTHAFVDPAVDAVLWLEDGDANAELLGRIDYDAIAMHPKPFVAPPGATV